MNGIHNVDRWIERIRDAYLSEDEPLTNSLIEQALRATDSAPQLLEISGMIAYKYGDAKESIRLIETAMFELGLSISGQLTLANAWLETGKLDAARTTVVFLVEMIDRVPCSMLQDLAQLLSALQEYELAIAACRTAFERHPDDDNAVFGAACYMHRAGYPLELVKNVMLKAVELTPDSMLYHANLAIIYCSLANWTAAYKHACRLSDQALQSIPCECMVHQIAEIFARFEDTVRLQKLNVAG